MSVIDGHGWLRRIGLGIRGKRSFCVGVELRHIVVMSLLAAVTAGCATWKGIRKDDLSKEIQGRQPAAIWVVQGDSTYELRRPSIHADTLSGSRPKALGGRTVFIRDDAIDSVAVRAYNRTPERIIAASLVVLSTVFVILANQPKGVY
jgi:hypothetical protein